MWKYILSVVACLLPVVGHSLKYEIQVENEKVRVSKLTVMPGEQIGLHHDESPRVIIGLKGGVITRYEEDGSTKEIHFPTDSAVFLEADPPGQQHRAANQSSEPIKIIVIELKQDSKG